MNAVSRLMFLSILGIAALASTQATAQPPQVDRDADGRMIIQWRQERNRPNANYVLPYGEGNRYTGTYFVDEDQHYYIPRTRDNRRRRVEPRAYEFGGFSHVDDLALRLENLANAWCLDLHSNYSHNRGFRTTYREAYQILEVAKYVHDAEHRRNREAIQQRLRGLDRQFHHVQEDVRGWSRHQHRQIGGTDMRTKMQLVENTIHHLMYDVGVRHGDEHDHQHPDGGRGGIGEAPRPQ